VLPETERRYRAALDRLSAALVAYRHAEPRGAGRASNNNTAASWCAGARGGSGSLPPWRRRAPIVCGVCSSLFASAMNELGGHEPPPTS
jgi:anti-sigma factor RsiW